jgi:hypothetical protein
MKHMLVLIALLLAAAVFYIAGSVSGVIALVGVGVLLELACGSGSCKSDAARISSLDACTCAAC